MSNHNLTIDEITILSKNLKFCPTPQLYNTIEYECDTEKLCRCLRLTEYFHGMETDIIESNSLIQCKSRFVPGEGRNQYLDSTISAIKNIPAPKRKEITKYNISIQERKAITSLKENKDVIIKEADKGSSIVIMNKQYYLQKSYDILMNKSDYEELPENTDNKTMLKIKKLISRHKSELTATEIKYLTDFEYKTSNFYGLPKIHKSKTIETAIKTQNSEVIVTREAADLKLRPIIAGPVCPTHRLSHFIDTIIQPLIREVKAYVKDDFDMLRRLPSDIQDDLRMVTMDVENLYGSIPHNLGIEAIEFWLLKRRQDNTRISREFIIEGLKLILENNIFYFNGKYFRQLKGTAMGTKVAPSYSTLVLGYLEQLLYDNIKHTYSNLHLDYFVKNYFRYLDDILLFYKESYFNVNDVHNMLNELNEHINVTIECAGRSVHFLDINLSIVNNKLETDIYYKLTDSKQYLNFRSHHPHHIKVALPYNLARRICTIVSDNDLKLLRLDEMKKSLMLCKYPESLVNDGIKKALSVKREDLIKVKLNNKKNNDNHIIYVTTYNSNYDDNCNIVKPIFNTLKSNNATCQIFNNKNLLMSKRQPPNLKQILTNAKFEIYKTNGVYKCRSARCQLCTIIIEGNNFYFSNVKINFEILENMNCNTLNCIYVLQCCGCLKYYIGETSNFRLRTNLHRDHINKSKGLPVSKHINECTKNKNLKFNFNIMPFYKIKSDDIIFRKQMEFYFISKLKPDLNKLV